MKIRYTNESLFANEYKFALDWNLLPQCIRTRETCINVSVVNMKGEATYLPFFVYFYGDCKPIYTYSNAKNNNT